MLKQHEWERGTAPRGPGRRRLHLVLAALAALTLLSGGTPARRAPIWNPGSGCSTDIGLPLRIRLVPEGDLRSGSAAGVRVEVVGDRSIDDVEVRVAAPQEVRILAAPPVRWGDAGAHEVRSEHLTLLVPGDGRRRTLDVVVDATVGGVRLRRGATLNLSPGHEAFRVIEEPGGRRIREVRAEKLR